MKNDMEANLNVVGLEPLPSGQTLDAPALNRVSGRDIPSEQQGTDLDKTRIATSYMIICCVPRLTNT